MDLTKAYDLTIRIHNSIATHGCEILRFNRARRLVDVSPRELKVFVRKFSNQKHDEGVCW